MIFGLSKYPALSTYISSLRLILAGSFLMGRSGLSTDENTGHHVTLSAFQMGDTPVTVELWKEYCVATGMLLPEAPPWGLLDDHPVVNVSWNDIMGTDGNGGFCAWASDLSGYRLTLPTEAQFEFAARVGQRGQEYHWGNAFNDSKLWCSVAVERQGTSSVYRSTNIFQNAYGLTDMSGNVMQWCYDLYGPYESRTQIDPTGPSSVSQNSRCVRGVSWSSDEADFFRCTDRSWVTQEFRYDLFGFRLSAGPG